VHFEVSPPKESSEVIAKSIATINNKTYSTDQVIIDYSHISKQQVLEPAEAKFIKLDLKTNGQKNWLYYGGPVTRFLKVWSKWATKLIES
jgi:hypothetical protein